MAIDFLHWGKPKIDAMNSLGQNKDHNLIFNVVKIELAPFNPVCLGYF